MLKRYPVNLYIETQAVGKLGEHFATLNLTCDAPHGLLNASVSLPRARDEQTAIDVLMKHLIVGISQSIDDATQNAVLEVVRGG
jgi:hypothetical protein